jgi:hypothetical protein
MKILKAILLTIGIIVSPIIFFYISVGIGFLAYKILPIGYHDCNIFIDYSLVGLLCMLTTILITTVFIGVYNRLDK